MAKVTAIEYQEKHARRLKASLPDMEKGIGKVTTAPGVSAAKKSAKMLANLTARVQDGTWSRRVAGVTLEDWKSKMINKGLNRVAGGIDEAAAKTIAMADQLLPAVDAAAAKAKAMPDMTLEDSINRMTTFVRDMAKFKVK